MYQPYFSIGEWVKDIAHASSMSNLDTSPPEPEPRNSMVFKPQGDNTHSPTYSIRLGGRIISTRIDSITCLLLINRMQP
jgi:hypothetical protein